MFKNIFSPIKIGPIEIPNRLVVPAMVMNFCEPDGAATERYTAYHEAKAKGGWGLIITEDYAVDPRGKGFPNIPGLWNDGQIEGHLKFTRRIHALDSKIFAQIYHAGRQTNRRVIGCQPVAPTPIPCPAMQEMPHELSGEEIDVIIEKFGDCARRVREAGFDGLEIHGAHGYLIAQFMSPYSNKRTDEYGGSLANRMRFPLAVIKNIQGKVGKDFPVIFRISGDELVRGGRKMEETKRIATMLEEAGVHALHISAGVYESSYGIIPPAAVRHGWITGFAQEIKQTVRIPVIAVGRINDPFLAEAIIAEKKADLVAMGRASLADPDLPRKAASGKCDDINRCIGCLQGCNGRITMSLPATCMVNPTLGKEGTLKIETADVRKKVFIAGAGPAGMEAAMVAAKRGHEVHVFEKNSRTGGQFYMASIPPHKGEIAGFIAWQQKQLEDLGGAIHLKQELTEKIIHDEKPHTVIVATGSHPLIPAWLGGKNENVVTAHDVLEGNARVGLRVAVIGGGMIGAETAHYLASQGKDVTIVEMLPRIAVDEAVTARYFLMKSLAEKKVKIHVKTTLKEIINQILTIETSGGIETLGPFDTIVLALGLISSNPLSAMRKGSVTEVRTIGDAAKIGKALEAIAEGYMTGLAI